jgi:hypothetical protein
LVTTLLFSFHEVNAKLQIDFGFLRFSNSPWVHLVRASSTRATNQE